MKSFLSLICTLLVYQALFSQEERESAWSMRGYVKHLESVIDFEGFNSYLIDQLIHNRLNIRYEPTDKFQLAIDVRSRIFYGDLIKLTPNYADQIEAGNNDFFDFSAHLVNKNDWLINSTIDRAYIQYTTGSLETRIGRQRINWGISTVWNPNDLFNAFAFTDFDYEERPGSDAVRVKYYTGVASSVEIAASAAKTFDRSVIAALYKWNVSQYDFQLLTGYARGDLVVGGGWAGNLKTAGFKGEWSYFISEHESNSLALTAAIDYSFTSGIYVNAGYLYNSNGETKGTLLDLFSFQLSAKNLYPFRHAIFLSGAYPITPLLNTSLAFIYSPISSHPLFVNPTLTYSVAQSWDLDLVGQIAFNKANGKYESPVIAGFLRLKLSF